MKPKNALRMFKEMRLDARGSSIRDHWKRWHPKAYKRLDEQGEAEDFFLKEQEAYYAMEDRLAKQSLPGGGAHELLRERFYPLSPEEQASLRPPKLPV
jgi:hypothetical protein